MARGAVTGVFLDYGSPEPVLKDEHESTEKQEGGELPGRAPAWAQASHVPGPKWALQRRGTQCVLESQRTLGLLKPKANMGRGPGTSVRRKAGPEAGVLRACQGPAFGPRAPRFCGSMTEDGEEGPRLEAGRPVRKMRGESSPGVMSPEGGQRDGEEDACEFRLGDGRVSGGRAHHG